MKIISKYPDYYDYLSKLYGEEPNIVLDRREGVVLKEHELHTTSVYQNYKPLRYVVHRVAIANKLYTGVSNGNSIVWGRDAIKYGTKVTPFLGELWKVGYDYIEDVEYKNVNLNIEQDCPIMMVGSNLNCLCRYPQLSSLNFSTVMSPIDMYITLSNWIAAKYNKCVLEPENKLKIKSHGFNDKSFKHRK